MFRLHPRMREDLMKILSLSRLVVIELSWHLEAHESDSNCFAVETQTGNELLSLEMKSKTIQTVVWSDPDSCANTLFYREFGEASREELTHVLLRDVGAYFTLSR